MSLEKRLLNCSSMNVPNRPQLKLLCRKGQAANVADISQIVFGSDAKSDARWYFSISACDCTRRAVRLISTHVVFWQMESGPAGRRVFGGRQRLFADGSRPAGRGEGAAFRPGQKPRERDGLCRRDPGIRRIAGGQPAFGAGALPARDAV